MGGLNTEPREIETTVPAYKGKARLSKGGLYPARDETGIWLGYLQLIEQDESTR
jgi:hypothetical protein